MIVTVHLPDDVGLRLKARASRGGQGLEDYVLHLLERDAATAEPALPGDESILEASPLQPGGGAALSDVEFEALLDELAAGAELPHLPADFSRADIYSDHD
jgi:hypothetical protein